MPSDLNWGAVLNFEHFALVHDSNPCKFINRELIAHYCRRQAQSLGGEPIAQHGEQSGDEGN